MDRTAVLVNNRAQATAVATDYTTPDWRFELPILTDGDIALREVRMSDAPALAVLLTAPEITRFISAPPSTVEGFERFIAGSQRLRAAGEGACFAITLRGFDTAIGIFQVRQVASGEDEARQIGGAIECAEWGFAIGSPFWGTGLFQRGARMVIAFAFEQMGVHRLEARCAVRNGRGGNALRKIGATPEGVLRKAFLCGGEYLDQVLYTIVAPEWRTRTELAATDVQPTLH
jgi:ribosomal-protein-alanine N-acetyltransferase